MVAPTPLPAPAPAASPRRFPDTMTLGAAIALHHARLGPQQAGGGATPETTAALFAGHDACHAIFDCGTDLRDETRVDLWTLAATTMTTRRYLDYLQAPEVTALLAGISLGALLRALPAMAADGIRIWWRGRGARPWDFDAWADHLDEPLGDIRARCGIAPLPAR